jgi:predicted amidophosphoribosyltransferase
MPIKINPRKLKGPWVEGFALDFETTGSRFLGYNAYGHPVFETQRPPIGELLYRLKNRGDATAVEPIVEAARDFLTSWNPKVDAIVPVPPSNTARKRQPVREVAAALSNATNIPLCESCLSKVKSTSQLKNIFDYSKRAEILASAFAVDVGKTRGKRLLLFDDLFRSGATAGAITRLLTDAGGASAVYLLTLTRTRKLV